MSAISYTYAVARKNRQPLLVQSFMLLSCVQYKVLLSLFMLYIPRTA